jgi:hypothetical protein
MKTVLNDTVAADALTLWRSGARLSLAEIRTTLALADPEIATVSTMAISKAISRARRKESDAAAS